MSTTRGPGIDAFAGKRVLVIGDVMLDELVRGDVTRISPEAPVPVLAVSGRTSAAGGAANAAANVASLGGKVTLVGVVGDDEAGRQLASRLSEASIDAKGLVIDPSRPTTQKTRIVARNQQIVRIDSESSTPLGLETEAAVVAAVAAMLEAADACIVSDYAKGVITPRVVRELVAGARVRGIPVVVDPKRKDFSVYAGATVVTPNTGELEAAAGRSCATTEDVLAAAGSLMGPLGGAALLATRGASGMSLFEAGRAPVHVPARARAVFDVTGAGDTVVGTIALALACRIPLHEAIELASAAAAIVVSKVGTATVSLAELRAELEHS